MVFSSGLVLNFVVRVSIDLAHHEAGHSISAAVAKIVRTLIAARSVKAEDAVRRVGLNVILLVQTPFKTKLHVVIAMHLVQRDGELAGILPLFVVAVWIA